MNENHLQAWCVWHPSWCVCISGAPTGIIHMLYAQMYLWAQNTPQSMRTSLQHHQHSCAVVNVVIRQQHQHLSALWNSTAVETNWFQTLKQWHRQNFMRVNRHRTVWKHSDVIHRAPGPVNATSVSRLAIVHAEVHCDAEITFQDRSWLHASKFLPQIEIVFKTI